MNAIEKRVRFEMWCDQRGYNRSPAQNNCGITVPERYAHPKVQIAWEAWQDALTPPEGYVLVPAEPTEKQWGGLARDIVMWLECYPTRSADSLLMHLRRCGAEVPEWLLAEVNGGPHTIDKGTVAVLIYKAFLADCPEVTGG